MLLITETHSSFIWINFWTPPRASRSHEAARSWRNFRESGWASWTPENPLTPGPNRPGKTTWRTSFIWLFGTRTPASLGKIPYIIPISSRKYIFKCFIFHCHVSFPGGLVGDLHLGDHFRSFWRSWLVVSRDKRLEQIMLEIIHGVTLCVYVPSVSWYMIITLFLILKCVG